ncbi:MAG: amidohydrolase family protein [Terriglobales bacterium]
MLRRSRWFLLGVCCGVVGAILGIRATSHPPRAAASAAAPHAESTGVVQPWAMESRLVVPHTLIQRFRYPVIDAHSHPYAGTSTAVGQWVKTLDQVGVRQVFILSGQTGAALRQTIAKYAGAYPGRYLVFAGLDKDHPEANDYGARLRQELDADLRAGARGLGELTDKGLGLVNDHGRRFYLDDHRFDPLWAEAGRRHVPVIVHVADPAAFYAPLNPQNELSRSAFWSLYGKGTPGFSTMVEKFAQVIGRFPQTQFVACHAFNLADDLPALGRLLDRYPNVDVDFAARYWQLARQPFTARRFLIRYQNRVLFGTDAGYDPAMYLASARVLETRDEWIWPPDREWWRGYGLGLPDAVLRKIYSGNALRVLDERGR